jgi:hypothetical protein
VTDPLSEPALWVIASILIYLLAALAGRRISVITQPRLVTLRQRWQGWLLEPFISGGVRLLYYLGIPYLAILQGSIDLRTIGLIGGDLPAALQIGVGVGLVAWVVLALAWRRLVLPTQATVPPTVGTWQRAGAWPGLFDAICAQAHWALYRSWPILLWGPYYGVFAGLALSAAEWLAGMLLGRAWARSGGPVWAWEIGLTRLGLALVTALVFMASSSLWACLLVHASLAWALFARWQPPQLLDASPAPGPG